MKNSSSKLNDFVENYYWFLFAGLAILVAMLCFLRLDVGYVSSWDEARHGISAYEMIQSKNYIVNTYNYDADYWNLKPPLSYYGIMFGFFIFGYSVAGLRFYSAMSYFLVCILCALFAKKYHGKWSSLLTLVFLCCNSLMLSVHGARTGSADAMYQLLFTIAMLTMMEIPEKHSKSYISGVCFSLAFLTKSYHAGIIILIGVLYMIISGQIEKFKFKEWVPLGLSMILPISIWGILRFTQDGLTFFMTMITEDVFNRSCAVSEGHAGNITFYFKRYFFDFSRIYWLLMLIIIAGLYWNVKKKESVKNYAGYFLWICLPLIVFSLVKTKLIWYSYPILVPVCMLAAIYIGKILENNFVNLKLKKIVLAIIFIAICLYGYSAFNEAVFLIHGDKLQVFIVESAECCEEVSKAKAYIQARQEVGDGSIWNQNNMFIAEIKGDFRCESYGVSGYQDCTEKKVIYISREDYCNMKELLTGKILYESEEYVMLGDNL